MIGRLPMIPLIIAICLALVGCMAHHAAATNAECILPDLTPGCDMPQFEPCPPPPTYAPDLGPAELIPEPESKMPVFPAPRLSGLTV